MGITAQEKAMRQAKFLMSAPTFAKCIHDTGREVAFAGRSNAGKSSAINALTHQKQLARVSKTPGRTQMINFFELSVHARLVDLPGYGYADVPLELKKNWQDELERYLMHRKSLVGLVLLSDIRHPIGEFDTQMLLWAKKANLTTHLLLTKSDKLKYGARMQTLDKVKTRLDTLGVNASVGLFSSLKREGVFELAKVMDDWLDLVVDMTALKAKHACDLQDIEGNA